LGFRPIGPSDYWDFGLSGLRTIGFSNYRTVGPTPQILDCYIDLKKKHIDHIKYTPPFSKEILIANADRVLVPRILAFKI
jgi:hypothetical protein